MAGTKELPRHTTGGTYAAWMAARGRGNGPEQASAAAVHYMAEVKSVVIATR